MASPVRVCLRRPVFPMPSSGWSERFFSSTRGQIVQLLRRQDQTVRELADTLDLTKNAIRSQLTKLEREDLVQPVGKRPRVRKPETVYGLTEEAEQIFPRAYDVLLRELIALLEERDDIDAEALLKAAGKRLAVQLGGTSTGTVEERVAEAQSVLEELGGLPELERQNGSIVLRGHSCPFRAVVEHHDAVCEMAAVLLAEMTGLPVQRACQVEEAPQCMFVFEATGDSSDGGG